MSQPFGNYQLVKKLATGGMAEVWLAKQTGIRGFNRHVVVKRILPHLAEDQQFVEMFLNEARLAAQLTHPNLGQIYDLGEQDGQFFIAMEYIRGEDLGRIAKRAWEMGQWLSRPVALRIIADACQGLYYAHTRTDDAGQPLNLVHRDVSPQNVLVSFDGTVKVVDFGIARAVGYGAATRSGAIKGKFAYMSPEHAGGRPLDARADVFALGIVLYELLTSTRPLKRDSELATLQAAMEGRIDPPSAVAEVPAEFDALVMRALAPRPEDRYRDAREFQLALEQALVEQGTVSTSVQVSQLMETLFADRLADEAKAGAPVPHTASSTGNPAARAPAATPRPPTPMPATPMPARPPTPPGDTRAARPITRRTATGPAIPASEPPPRRRTASSAAVKATPEPAAKKEPRRTASSAAVKVTPEPAPPTKDTVASLPPVVEKPSRRSKPAHAIPEAKPAAPGRARRWLATALMLVVLGAGGVGARWWYQAQHAGGVPLRLTVMTNPPTTVIVVPPAGSTRERSEGVRTPVEGLLAYVGDTVLLRNPDRDIEWPQVLAAGKRDQVVLIDKVFAEGTVKVTAWAPLRNAGIWSRLSGQRVGNLGDPPLRLFEGHHALELRADTLAAPIPFELTIKPGPNRDFPVRPPK